MSSMEELLNELGMIPPGNEARSVPQNAIGKYFADKLYGGRNFLNEKFGIPFVDTGLGLGDMFMAEGPEYIEELSWGRPFIEPTGHGFRIDTRLGDILGLPLPYAGGGALLKYGGKKGLQALMPNKTYLDSISSDWTDPNIYTHIAKDDFDFKDFDISKTKSNNKPFNGIFFNTDKKKPIYQAYTNTLEGKNTKPAYLNVKNPATDEDVLAVTKEIGGGYTKQELTDALIKRGFDGYINKNVGEIAVFDTKNIRSIFDKQSKTDKLQTKLEHMAPDSMSRRTFNKGLLGTIATAGLAAKGIPLGLKDIAGAGKPLAIDAIRTAVPAAARAATISVSPAVAKLGNLLLSHGAGDAKHLAKVFKEKGIKGLEKELNEGYIDIKFQNVPDIDPYAVESFVHAGPKAFNRSFKNISSMPKKLMKELKEELNYTFQPDHDLFDSMGFDITASRYMDLGYDPQDLAKILTKSIDIEKLRKTNPKMADEFSKHMNLLLKHPDDYLLDLDDFVGDMAWRQNMTGYRGLDEITEYNVFEFFKE